MSVESVIDSMPKAQFEAFIDQHREALHNCLDGLTEQQARRSLLASRTTLLGLAPPGAARASKMGKTIRITRH